MSSFGSNHILYRQLGGYVGATWVSTGETEIAFKSSIQPATGKDMENLDAGRRQKDVRALYPSIEIQTLVDGDGGTQPDQIEIDGERYEAVHVEPWQNNVINHYRALFARKN